MGSVTVILGSQWGELTSANICVRNGLTLLQVTKVYVSAQVRRSIRPLASSSSIILTIVSQKGKLTDHLLSTNSFDVCARAQGGHNAGHTVK